MSYEFSDFIVALPVEIESISDYLHLSSYHLVHLQLYYLHINTITNCIHQILNHSNYGRTQQIGKIDHYFHTSSQVSYFKGSIQYI